MAQNTGNVFIDGESVIEDENSTYTITNTGAVVSTVEKQFGDSSIYFGTNSYISIPASTDWDFGTGTFTIDFWFKTTSLVDSQRAMLSQYTGGASWEVYSTHLGIGFFTGDGPAGSTTCSPDSWTHFALTRVGNTFTIYINGVSSNTSSHAGAVGTNTNDVYIGVRDAAFATPFPGYMDNIRIIKGEALWTSNFDLTEEALFYPPADTSGYVRPDNFSELYSIGSRGNLRGKADEGFIRPTLKQFFTSTDFEEISK